MRVVSMVAVTLALSLGVVSATAAAPANVAPTRIAKIPLPSDYDDIAQIIGSGTSWLVVGNIDNGTVASSALFPNEVSKGGSDGYVAMLSSDLRLVWSHRFGTSQDDVATAIARDRDGVIWGVGVTTKEAQPAPNPTPTPTTTQSSPAPTPSPSVSIANPDGVLPVTQPSALTTADQLIVSSWSNSGELLSQHVQTLAAGMAIDPTAIVGGKTGMYVVGTAINPSSGVSRGFFLLVAKDGSTGPIHWVGSKAVALRSAALLSNGSLLVAGSIAEPLAGRPMLGPVDAFVAVLNPTTGAVLRTQRSGDKSASRSWESVSVDRLGNLMAVGESQVGSKHEVVATSFSSKGVVRFSLRLAGPVGTQAALGAPAGASALIAVGALRPGRKGSDAYLAPIGASGKPLSPTYLAGKAGTGLVAAAAGSGYLLGVDDAAGLTLAWFAPRGGK